MGRRGRSFELHFKSRVEWPFISRARSLRTKWILDIGVTVVIVWFCPVKIGLCVFWLLFALWSPTAGHSLPFYFHCTAAWLYLALLSKQCVPFTRGFTHWPIAVYLVTLIQFFFSVFFLFFLPLQVKVWFQNRRTKFKRQKLEEEGSESQQKKKGSHHINRWRLATKQASPEEIDVTSDD